jgi:hypothetical protein
MIDFSYIFTLGFYFLPIEYQIIGIASIMMQVEILKSNIGIFDALGFNTVHEIKWK